QMQTQLIKNKTDQKSFYEEINRITEKDILFSMFSNIEGKSNIEDDIKRVDSQISNESIDNDVEVINVDNSKNKTRENVYVVFKDKKLTLEQRKCRLLNFEDKYLEYESVTHHNVRIYYKDIKNIKTYWHNLLLHYHELLKQ
ncbi:MAG: hypothetical protein KH086_03915, partial [Coprobacillus sp.]|nr:hypothetical protein [Coprobacillus sp.]